MAENTTPEVDRAMGRLSEIHHDIDAVLEAVEKLDARLLLANDRLTYLGEDTF